MLKYMHRHKPVCASHINLIAGGDIPAKNSYTMILSYSIVFCKSNLQTNRINAIFLEKML